MAGLARPFLAVSPALSARAMLMHYGRTHLAHGMSAMPDGEVHDSLAVPVTSAGRMQDEPLLCVPPQPRLWWLRRDAAAAVNVALAARIF